MTMSFPISGRQATIGCARQESDPTGFRGGRLNASLQGGRLYCLTEEETGQRVFQTRPDILIKRGGEVVQIIDTKWKRISSRLDDPKRGVSQADVCQMMAYGQLYGAERLTLIYPHHHGLAPEEGRLACHTIGDGLARLETQGFDVADGKGTIARLCDLLGHARSSADAALSRAETC